MQIIENILNWIGITNTKNVIIIKTKSAPIKDGHKSVLTGKAPKTDDTLLIL